MRSRAGSLLDNEDHDAAPGSARWPPSSGGGSAVDSAAPNARLRSRAREPDFDLETDAGQQSLMTATNARVSRPNRPGSARTSGQASQPRARTAGPGDPRIDRCPSALGSLLSNSAAVVSRSDGTGPVSHQPTGRPAQSPPQRRRSASHSRCRCPVLATATAPVTPHRTLTKAPRAARRRPPRIGRANLGGYGERPAHRIPGRPDHRRTDRGLPRGSPAVSQKPRAIAVAGPLPRRDPKPHLLPGSRPALRRAHLRPLRGHRLATRDRHLRVQPPRLLTPSVEATEPRIAPV